MIGQRVYVAVAVVAVAVVAVAVVAVAVVAWRFFISLFVFLYFFK